MKKIFLFIACFIILPQFIWSRGSAESDREYLSELEITFNQILIAVETDEMTSSEGKEKLADLRSRYNKPYSDEFGIMEALLDQLEEDLIAYADARYHYSLLQIGKLMEYRQERKRDGAVSNSESENPVNSGSGNSAGNRQQNNSENNDNDESGASGGNNQNSGSQKSRS